MFGRMERTAAVEGIPTVRWRHAGRRHAIPAVVHRTWRAPAGRLAIAFANWTAEARRVRVVDPRFATDRDWIVAAGEGHPDGPAAGLRPDEPVEIPGRTCGLLVVSPGGRPPGL